MTAQFQLGGRLMIPTANATATGDAALSTTATLDALGEAIHYSGQVYMVTGSGSHTISSAGGKIHWRTGTVTFANAGTTLRIGIQDVSTTATPGHGDGTFDVYADLVGGTDTVASTVNYATAMETGTKTIAHGDHISVVWTLTARGGTDSVVVASILNTAPMLNQNYPAVTTYLSATWSRANSPPCLMIEFDDGAFGYIVGGGTLSTSNTPQVYNSGTGTADEYGNIFSFPYPVVMDGIWFNGNPNTASADFEVCLYSDPLGTPVLIEAITFDASRSSDVASPRQMSLLFSTPRELLQNTTYGLTVRPTTADDVTTYYFDVPANGLKVWQLGETCYAIRRLDNTGAFSEYNGGTAKTRRFAIGFLPRAFQDAWGYARAQSHIGL